MSLQGNIMKKFEHKSTFKDAYEIMCYAHNSEVHSATLAELEEFLETLLKHFPHKNYSGDGSVRPYDESSSYMQQWRAAHDHIVNIINERKAAKRFKYTMWVSGATLLVLILTLVFQVVAKYIQIDVQPEPVSKAIGEVTKPNETFK
jgi:hypothetical protein